jgi:hypothetical protein
VEFIRARTGCSISSKPVSTYGLAALGDVVRLREIGEGYTDCQSRRAALCALRLHHSRNLRASEHL